DRVLRSNSRGKKLEVEEHRRNVKLPKNKTYVTACNKSLNAKTLNVKSVSAMCDKCVLIDKHAMCVLKSVAKPLKKTAVSELNKKPRNLTRKLYEHLIEIVLFNVDSGCSKHMTGYLKLLINFVEKFLGTVKFGNDQIAPILGYGDLVQRAVTIKRVYYVEGLNHNLFSVGQFCDVDLEVAFRKSTCFIRNLKGNDLLTDSRGTNLYSITLQNSNSHNPICLMAKATSSQAWLWHRRLSHLNFDTINLLSKNDIVVAMIVGYGDYQMGETIISRVYYVEGLKHNLFSKGELSQGRIVADYDAKTFKDQAYFILNLPQLKSNPKGDRVLRSNSHGKKLGVEEHHRNVKLLKNKMSVIACNDSLNVKTVNVTSVSAMCAKCLIEIVLFIVDSGCSKHMTGNLKLLINFVEKFLGTVKFGNDQIAPILGYGDLVQGAVTIKRVYYVEGLNHNLFSVGQFCDADLEVAFRKSTCFIRDLKGNDFLT
nr:integrase, catalytic region, zinc finger, CCHC-type, peptidase aspartic, catalytic [Tanacetum cinerariifolium]